ncbi:metal-dependent hydrolase [Falsiroseomonas sp.]|uniref:metal-dependent hydrolase n=1 Tax=Falsiroseomonas sp. TaxID=2870721 RepID=UPI0034A1DC35
MPDAALDIIPRDLRFDLVENADAAWFDGDPLKSAIMDGFAVLLPEGERFFIRSLRHYVDRVGDPVVRQDIQGYAVQEAFHTREHEAYNQALRKLGQDVDSMEAAVRAKLADVKGPFPRLLVTCAIEQMTYAFARFNLSRPALMQDSRPAYRRLWIWHALEELEHSAVSLRVLRAATPDLPGWKRYFARVAVMNVVLARFLPMASRNITAMARASGVQMGVRSWLRVLWLLLGQPGFLRAALPPLLAYYRPGYTGQRAADVALVQQGRAALAAELGTEFASGAARMPARAAA